MRLVLLLLLTATIVAASNASIDDGHLMPQDSRVVAFSRAETSRNLRGSEKPTETEDSAAEATESEERMFSGLSKLRNVFKKNPGLAKTLARDPRVSEAVAKSSGSIYQKAVGRVRALLTRNPSMTRGLNGYQTEQLLSYLTILSCLALIGASVFEILQIRSKAAPQ